MLSKNPQLSLKKLLLKTQKENTLNIELKELVELLENKEPKKKIAIAL